MKRFLLLIGFVGILLPRISSAEGYRSVLAPKAFRPGTPYNVTATNYDTDPENNAEIGVVIVGSDESVLASGRATVTSGETEIITLPIPDDVPYLSYVLRVEGINASVTEYALEVKRKSLSIFVQTDKAVYKPGQNVLFRVIGVYPDLKPYPGSLDIVVYDPFSNRIMQKLNQQNATGVTTHSLALAAQTAFGDWKIVVTASENTFTKTFEVREYVLPKFEVNVILPTYYLVNLNRPDQQKDLLVTVTAKYTYGQPVKGRANVTIQIEPYGSWDSTNYTTRNLDVELNEGKADITLTIEELVALVPDNGWGDQRQQLSYRSILVVASVTETVTGVALSGNSTVPCKSQEYSLTFLDITPSNFKPSLVYWAFLQFSQADGSPPDPADVTQADGSRSTITVVATINYDSVYNENTTETYWPPSTSLSVVVTIDLTGLMSFSLEIPQNASSCNLQATYEEAITNTTVYAYKYLQPFKTRDAQGIQVSYDSLESFIKSSEEAKFIVNSTVAISTFQYAVMAKGSILLSDAVTGDLSTRHTFSFWVTKTLSTQLAPRARIVVWYLTSSGEMVADSTELPVQNIFANEVSLSFSVNETSPGENVSLTVRADAGSTAFLLAVDQSVLLLKGGNDVTQSMVFQDLNDYDTASFNPGGPWMFMRCWWPINGENTRQILDKSGLISITEAYVKEDDWNRNWWFMRPEAAPAAPGDGEKSADGGNNVDGSKPRVFFPETWIWTDETIGPDGKITIKATAPDTITSWIASAFGINPVSGLGVAANTAKVTVFKPFFASPTLPYSIRRGEEFALKVAVFNYLSTTVQVVVTLQRSSYFDVYGSNTKTVKVASNDAVSVSFWIIAKALGQIPITISAVSPVAGDTLTVMLLVKPEGVEKQFSTSSFIRLSSSTTTYNSTFDVALPPRGVLVEGSQYLEITCIGDIMGSSIKGLDNLLQMPGGCGEQNMLYFAPDVYILDYLAVSGQLTSDIEGKARGFLVAGYQQELTYQRTDGSFSAFGNSDTSGSAWLSAFVIKCFDQARDYIPVEDSKIAQTMSWILALQSSDGSFAEPPGGRVIHVDMQGGSSNGLALSAYVYIALLQNRNNSVVDPSLLAGGIASARNYLEQQVDNVTSDPYALCITAYAMAKDGSSKLPDVLQRLQTLAINEGGTTHWEKAGETPPPNTWWYYPTPKAINIEMTAYALLTYCHLNDLEAALPIGKWIIAQRNPDGGFSSTQDTVMALEALAALASLLLGPDGNRNLQVSIATDSIQYSFLPITKETAMLLQSYQIPSNTTKVFVTATGTGSAIVQLNAKLNVYATEDGSAVGLSANSTQVDDRIRVDVCSSWNKKEGSGMALMEFYLLTGYKASNVDDLKSQSKVIKRVDVDNSKISIYFDELISEPTCIYVVLEKVNPVGKVKDAPIKVYPYYDPTAGRTVFYGVPQGLEGISACTECPDCCIEDSSTTTEAPKTKKPPKDKKPKKTKRKTN